MQLQHDCNFNIGHMGLSLQIRSSKGIPSCDQVCDHMMVVSDHMIVE